MDRLFERRRIFLKAIGTVVVDVWPFVFPPERSYSELAADLLKAFAQGFTNESIPRTAVHINCFADYEI